MLWSAKTRVHLCWTWTLWGLQAQLDVFLLWGNFSDPFQRWVNDKIYILVQISVEMLLEQGHVVGSSEDSSVGPSLQEHLCLHPSHPALTNQNITSEDNQNCLWFSRAHTPVFGGPIQVTHVSVTCVCAPHMFGAVRYTELTVLISADFLSQKSLDSLRKTSAEIIFTQNLLASKPDSFLLKLFKHPEIFALPQLSLFHYNF